jgi:hypothetical protein
MMFFNLSVFEGRGLCGFEELGDVALHSASKIRRSQGNEQSPPWVSPWARWGSAQHETTRNDVIKMRSAQTSVQLRRAHFGASRPRLSSRGRVFP